MARNAASDGGLLFPASAARHLSNSLLATLATLGRPAGLLSISSRTVCSDSRSLSAAFWRYRIIVGSAGRPIIQAAGLWISAAGASELDGGIVEGDVSKPLRSPPPVRADPIGEHRSQQIPPCLWLPASIPRSSPPVAPAGLLLTLLPMGIGGAAGFALRFISGFAAPRTAGHLVDEQSWEFRVVAESLDPMPS